jgi:hypothetical protein
MDYEVQRIGEEETDDSGNYQTNCAKENQKFIGDSCSTRASGTAKIETKNKRSRTAKKFEYDYSPGGLFPTKARNARVN